MHNDPVMYQVHTLFQYKETSNKTFKNNNTATKISNDKLYLFVKQESKQSVSYIYWKLEKRNSPMHGLHQTTNKI
ncbi:hypothetical protein T12_780 [Trichinella patagoniensis]|uniref:Uncharacterized protein n=1 Tax=Trichinella patagoniensis TaxID=990121 RepID=A0A0V0ZWC0_9BILA|nr:hypothetical protein T12_780 [Trichinella patagoniensis]